MKMISNNSEQLKNTYKSLIIIPFAYINDYKTGVNVSKKQNIIDLYMKNCCVACISARSKNDFSVDVAFVTNIDIPLKYKKILIGNHIKIYKVHYDRFLFTKEYSWSLAFYKLCALSHVVEDYNYDYYCYLDSDVYVQNSFDLIWKECSSHILLYDFCHGLQASAYNKFVLEVNQFCMLTRGERCDYITHYGGEFFAANRENTLVFIKNCNFIYNQMIQLGFNTTRGDEFIISLSADVLGKKIKNAGAYIFRFWTGYFRLIYTGFEFDPITILHCPSEKSTGLIKIFNKYVDKGKAFPSNYCIHKLLHLRRMRLKTWLQLFFQRIKMK